uniref:Uncharacterized protein n=1 Tax=Solanum lycopersicum TaxID=4081 RepID=A0A3Q7JMS1_SOLLC
MKDWINKTINLMKDIPLKMRKRTYLEAYVDFDLTMTCTWTCPLIRSFNLVKQLWSSCLNEKPFDAYNFGIAARTSIPFENPGRHKNLVSRLTPSTLRDATAEYANLPLIPSYFQARIYSESILLQAYLILSLKPTVVILGKPYKFETVRHSKFND